MMKDRQFWGKSLGASASKLVYKFPDFQRRSFDQLAIFRSLRVCAHT
jgi:hypothetical protein